MTNSASDVKDLIGSPRDAGELSGGAKDVVVATKPDLVTLSQTPVFERTIPDAGLPTEYVEGVLDIANEGSGLLRPKFAASERDVYISSSQIRRFNLKVGDKVGGQARRPKENERYWGLLKVEKING
ncbi:hypothetical protein COY30_01525, partial [Candidatus Woesebacteria bacterium CG_4_10_14_0_2_um_filter_44_9]